MKLKRMFQNPSRVAAQVADNANFATKPAMSAVQDMQKATGLPVQDIFSSPWNYAYQTGKDPLRQLNNITGGLSDAAGVQPYVNELTDTPRTLWDQAGAPIWHGSTEMVTEPLAASMTDTLDSWGMQNQGKRGKMDGDGVESQPGLNDSNDPNMSAQFQRIRRAARALGRAGTIKYKGSGSLGLGDSILGDQLALIGTRSSQS